MSTPPTHHVVLVHASVSSPRQWTALVDCLEPDRTVHLPALIDAGEDPGQAAGTPQRIAHDAAQIEALLGRLGRAHLVAHSYGGAVALRAALRRPAAVASLVVYEPMLAGWLADDPDSWGELAELTLLARDCRELWLRQGNEGAAERFVDYWGGAGTWSAMPAAAQRSTAARMPSAIAQFRAMLAEPRGAAALPPVPTLLLSGRTSRAPARRIAERVAALCPGVRHRVLPGVGHMGPVTHARTVNALILGFLDEQPVPARPCPAIA